MRLEECMEILNLGITIKRNSWNENNTISALSEDDINANDWVISLPDCSATNEITVKDFVNLNSGLNKYEVIFINDDNCTEILKKLTLFSTKGDFYNEIKDNIIVKFKIKNDNITLYIK